MPWKTDVEWRIILKWVLNTQDGLGDLGCIHLVKDRSKWQAVVNTVMNVRVPQSMGNLLTMRGTVSVSRRPLPCGVRYCSVCLSRH
jgi:hypothetical protein